MTAFAAILQRGGGPCSFEGPASALAEIYGAPPSTISRGACTLLVSRLHADEPAAPVVVPPGIGAVGQVVLEDRRRLADVLAQPASADGVTLAAAAYAKWGEHCGAQLAGEFAFTLWDAPAQRLVCARDGMGLRLLYVAESAETLIVTNVLRAALRHPSIAGEIDEAALAAFLAHGGPIDETRTSFRDVKVLPAGHTLTVDLARGSTRMHRHWRFPCPDPAPRRNEGQVMEQYRATLREAVKDRLHPAGTSIFLSGGIDSTTIAAAACEITGPGALGALTARYPRYVDDGELPYTRAAAQALGIPLTVIDADRRDAWHVQDGLSTPEPLDEPMLADWRDSVRSAADFGTVALYGEDGDALLQPPGWRSLRARESAWSVAAAAARYAVANRKLPYLGIRWRERMGIRPRRSHSVPRWLTAAARNMLRPSEPATILGHAAVPLPTHPTRPGMQARLTSTSFSREFAATIAAEYTRQPLELRLPLFDTRIVELVLSLPAIPWCQQKALPRRAYEGRLPPEVLRRPKTTLRGFNEALVAGWRRSAATRKVQTRGSALSEWVDRDAWRRALDQGTAEDAMAAWRVLAVEAWIEQARAITDEKVPCIP